ANIVMSYGMQVGKELKQASVLDMEIIAPSHGIIFRKYVKEIVENYVKWSSNIVGKKALIVYDTMWDSTKKMAYTIQDAFEEKGYFTSMKCLQNDHISDIITEVLDAEYICVGCPTLNNNMLPTVASFLTYLKGLSPKKRKAIAFGSYGWGGQSIGQVEEELKQAKFDVIATFKEQYIPSKEKLDNIKKELKEKI
ncbi:MAG: MBL fold metallo-hydrolase, partial [Fusobacteriia bacterium 4572_132]